MLSFFFFNDTATTEIYTRSLHDALPILGGQQVDDLDARLEHLGPALELVEPRRVAVDRPARGVRGVAGLVQALAQGDRKSTRLNSSHANISYAVFCLKKKHYIRHMSRLH